MKSPKLCETRPVASSDTKSAVEAAISASKGKPTATWEEAVQGALAGVSRWEEFVPEHECDDHATK
jgi:hypothetical protein